MIPPYQPRGRKYPEGSIAKDLVVVDEEVSAVLYSLEEGPEPTIGPKRNREINGLHRALHALRQARTKVEPDMLEPPAVAPTEGP